jgi:pimeloyl-ACP methyl ester carboxylesterase
VERLERPDGVEIAFEVRGEGPLVALVNQFIGVTSLYAALLDDLARDHRVLVYDPRGAGDSTRQGPYDLETDLADLEAVVEQAGGDAVLLGVSDGNIRAVRLAERRPDLVRAVLSIAASTLGQTPVGSDALAGSGQVLSAFVKLMRADLRSGVRAMMSSGGTPAWETEEEMSRRVDESAAYTSSEAAAERLSTWVGDDSTEQALAVGDRLWILAYGGNPWFPADQADRMRRALPEARVLEVENGAVSRPDIAAGVARRITAPD